MIRNTWQSATIDTATTMKSAWRKISAIETAPVFEAPARYLVGTSFSKLPSNCETALTTIRRRSADQKGVQPEAHFLTDNQEALINTIVGWLSDRRLSHESR